MAATRVRVSRLIVALALGPVAASPLELTAQDGAPEPEAKVAWELGPGEGGFCIHFLVAPREAAGLLLKGQQPLSAADVPDLPAPLRRVVADEPQYAGWVPSQACVWFTEALTANRRRYDRGDGGKPLALFWWGLAATSDLLGGKPGLSQVVLATNSSGLKRQMELVFIEMERINIDRDSVRESEDEEIRFRLDRTVVAFAGHPRPDSTLVPAAVEYRSVVKGDGNRLWTVEFNAAPTGITALAGSLRIQGKGALADALTASPIRLIGNSSTGGWAGFRFHD